MTRDTYRPTEYGNEPLCRAMDKLRSFQDGDIAVLEVVACGVQAVPYLQRLLFEREPSGLFHIRTRAVDALARLGAHNTLIGFLATKRRIDDPVERLGEDVVISAAARALAYYDSPELFDVLVALAHRPCLTGVIFALGASRRREAIPSLVDALAEDASRPTAEIALKRFGIPAQSALVDAANRISPHEDQSESRLRQRRAALRLLADMGVSSKTWALIRPLVDDTDPQIAMLACEICLRSGSLQEKRGAVLQLLRLFCGADWTRRDEIEHCLGAHLDLVKATIAGSSQFSALEVGNDTAAELARRILH